MQILNIITPTGARPEAFSNCVEYMKAQEYTGPVKWVIVDDGPESMETPTIKDWEILHIRPKPLWSPGKNTQARNLKEGLKHIEGTRVIIVEDDDKYASWWLKQCNQWLQINDLVGEAPSVYRHLDGSEKCMGNKKHASLCSTAMKGKALEDFKKVLCQTTSLDYKLWQKFKGNKKIYPYNGGVIGIKGYPGRPGIGVGHKKGLYK